MPSQSAVIHQLKAIRRPLFCPLNKIFHKLLAFFNQPFLLTHLLQVKSTQVNLVQRRSLTDNVPNIQEVLKLIGSFQNRQTSTGQNF